MRPTWLTVWKWINNILLTGFMIWWVAAFQTSVWFMAFLAYYALWRLWSEWYKKRSRERRQ